MTAIQPDPSIAVFYVISKDGYTKKTVDIEL